MNDEQRHALAHAIAKGDNPKDPVLLSEYYRLVEEDIDSLLSEITINHDLADRSLKKSLLLCDAKRLPDDRRAAAMTKIRNAGIEMTEAIKLDNFVDKSVDNEAIERLWDEWEAFKAGLDKDQLHSNGRLYPGKIERAYSILEHIGESDDANIVSSGLQRAKKILLSLVTDEDTRALNMLDNIPEPDKTDIGDAMDKITEVFPGARLIKYTPPPAVPPTDKK